MLNRAKHLIACATVAAAICPINGLAADNLDTDDIRIVSYNVHNGKGLDKITDYKRIAEVIGAASPDFVAVQEADSATNRSKGLYVLGEIARWADMQPVFGPAISFDGGKYGIGILSRQKPVATRQLPLPGREENRTLLIAEFDDCVFACTHLSLNKEDRLASIATILEAASQYDKPFFIAGDWNAEPDSELLARLSEDFEILSDTNIFTFPADKPDRCIDYIACLKATKGKLHKIQATVIDEPEASDHRPVFVALGRDGKSDQ